MQGRRGGRRGSLNRSARGLQSGRESRLSDCQPFSAYHFVALRTMAAGKLPGDQVKNSREKTRLAGHARAGCPWLRICAESLPPEPTREGQQWASRRCCGGQTNGRQTRGCEEVEMMVVRLGRPWCRKLDVKSCRQERSFDHFAPARHIGRIGTGRGGAGLKLGAGGGPALCMCTH